MNVANRVTRGGVFGAMALFLGGCGEGGADGGRSEAERPEGPAVLAPDPTAGGAYRGGFRDNQAIQDAMAGEFWHQLFKSMGPTVASGWSYIDNGRVRVGVNLSRGGGIGSIQVKGAPIDVVDAHDAGRYLQQSYYGGHQGGRWNGDPWPFNPVQGGDWTDVPSRVVSWSNDGKTLYVKTIPRDWGGLGETPCVMQEWVTLEGDFVKIYFQFKYDGKVAFPSRDQETPALFAHRSLGKLAYYDGPAPFRGDSVSRAFPPLLTKKKESLRVTPKEGWVAYVNDDDWGVGLYSRGTTSATTYRVGEVGVRGATSYAALLRQFALVPGFNVEYMVYVRVGNLAEVRKGFQDLWARGQ